MQEEVDEIIFALIAERRAEGAERDDVLAMLLEARHEDSSPMSEQEIRDELLTLLVAGHETTASSLAWTFSRLVHERPVLERLVEEIDAGEDAYVTATIQETLRARPVLPNVAPRLVAKPIEVGDWSYQPGCSLVANGYLIHHDPDIYPDPYSFRPDRFLDEAPGHLHLDPVRRRPPPLPRRQLRDARDESGPPHPARVLRATSPPATGSRSPSGGTSRCARSRARASSSARARKCP